MFSYLVRPRGPNQRKTNRGVSRVRARAVRPFCEYRDVRLWTNRSHSDVCVLGEQSRSSFFFWSRTDRGALCGGANGGPGQDVKLPPAHPSTPRLIKEPCCSQRQHEDTLQGCVVNKSAGLSRRLCIRSCGYGVGTPFWVPAHVIMERKMFSE